MDEQVKLQTAKINIKELDAEEEKLKIEDSELGYALDSLSRFVDQKSTEELAYFK